MVSTTQMPLHYDVTGDQSSRMSIATDRSGESRRYFSLRKAGQFTFHFEDRESDLVSFIDTTFQEGKCFIEDLSNSCAIYVYFIVCPRVV
jgi:hypothetical protein